MTLDLRLPKVQFLEVNARRPRDVGNKQKEISDNDRRKDESRARVFGAERPGRAPSHYPVRSHLLSPFPDRATFARVDLRKSIFFFFLGASRLSPSALSQSRQQPNVAFSVLGTGSRIGVSLVVDLRSWTASCHPERLRLVGPDPLVWLSLPQQGFLSSAGMILIGSVVAGDCRSPRFAG